MRYGISLIEVMIFVVILALAYVPMMGLGSATHRRAYFDEHQQLAQARAKTLLDLAAALDFDLLWAMAGGKVGQATPIDLETIFGAAALDSVFAPFAGTSSEAYSSRLKNLKHRATFTLKSPGLGDVAVDVSWEYAGDTKQQVHTVRLARTISRREEAFSQHVPLR
jgi:hypothetical protein